MPDIKLRDGSGVEQTYTGVDTITVPLADGTGTWTYGLTEEELTFTNASYMFENGNIYYYSFSGQSKVKTLGFYGSEFAEVSHTAGIDYECTLYAMWELITYKIDVVLVPTSTLSKIAFDEVFPEKEGRKPIYQDLQKYEVVGVRYEPGSQVIINAPYGNRGYKYYGWSYEEGIKDRTLLNTEPFNIEMPEEDIVVYLYYTMEVSVESYGNGEASISTKEVLYGESVTVNALPNDGYAGVTAPYI